MNSMHAWLVGEVRKTLAETGVDDDVSSGLVPVIIETTWDVLSDLRFDDVMQLIQSTRTDE